MSDELAEAMEGQRDRREERKRAMSSDDVEEIKTALESVADRLGKAYGQVNVMIIRTGSTEDDALRSAFFYKWERD